MREEWTAQGLFDYPWRASQTDTVARKRWRQLPSGLEARVLWQIKVELTTPKSTKGTTIFKNFIAKTLSLEIGFVLLSHRNYSL